MPPPSDSPGDGASYEPRLTVSAVARRLGIAPATLRTWSRRYGLGPTEHATGAHRRYTAADLARLEAMRRLTRDGVPPAEAARAVLAGHVPPPVPAAALRPAVPAAVLESVGAAPGGGGRVLALPGAGPAARGLARAAMALDVEAVVDVLTTSLATRGVVATWEELLRPVLVGVGARWEATGEGVEVEHLLSECALGVLRPLSQEAATAGLHVLVACTPDEAHSLPVHVLAAGLAERGVGCWVLGAATPADALAAAVRRVGPAVLFLWSQDAATGDPDATVATLPTVRPGVRVLVGGPGWNSYELPPAVTYADSLQHAIEAVASAAGVP